jgi:hypothetical protein
MLAQKEKTAKEVEKLTKNARMATIRSLIPRELYKHYGFFIILLKNNVLL